MPIMAAQPILYTQIKSMLSKGMMANPALFSAEFTTVLAGVVPMGIMMAFIFPMPLVPAGAPACQAMVNNALNLGIAANIEIVSTMLASAVSLLVPTVPPIGLTLLKTQINQALNLGIAANIDVVALMLSMAIPSYYMAGGVI